MKQGRRSFIFRNVYVQNSGVVVGPLESQGPLKNYFDKSYKDLHFDEKSWEKAEMKMFKEALEICLIKNNITKNDIEAIVTGDLNNQIIIGNYVLRDYDFPHIGVFSACSSFCESIIVASMMIEGENYNNVLLGISSHNATAERQFRYPLEYGGQKPPTFTYTVTGAGVSLLSSKKSNIRITRATLGVVQDNKLKDPQDMGRVMAIAAYDTIKQHFSDFMTDSSDYDLIVTGDLSTFGKDMLIKYLKVDNIILENYEDCGLMIFDRDKQEVFSGGSGCGCVTCVTLGYLLSQMSMGIYNRILVVATGALMNPIIVAQKETIPSIAHAVCFERSL